jgi:CoA:oxalate CoA-transferase
MPEMSTRYPLEGVRVLDLSRVLAGPYAARMLSDLGAEVVKVEPPEGDVTRQWGKSIAGLSGYYTQQNVGKQSVSIDLRRAGAPELVRRLAARADVLIENFRPGVMAQYGLAYADLAPLNPRLVMLSISGFGQLGPEAGRQAYAAVVHAESGIVQRQALQDGQPPRDPSLSIADMNAGLHGLAAVLAALYQREHTGQGQHIDIAMTDAMLATDDHVHLALDQVGDGRGFVNETWETAFGHIVLPGDFRWIFRQLSERCGLVDDTPPGASLAIKIESRRRAVRAFIRACPDREALYAALTQAELPWGEVRSTLSALDSPTSRYRGTAVETDDRAGGTRRVIQSPYRFSAARSGLRGPAPQRGEHNRAVLKAWLGIGDAEIEGLEAQGVLLADTQAGV